MYILTHYVKEFLKKEGKGLLLKNKNKAALQHFLMFPNVSTYMMSLTSFTDSDWYMFNTCGSITDNSKSQTFSIIL